MPREARVSVANGFFHCYNSGLEDRVIFKDIADYQTFLAKLSGLKTKKVFDHKLFAYLLLPSSFHLLLQTAKSPLSKIMTSLLTGYSVYFNKKYKRHGPLFADRFKSKLCEKKNYLSGCLRYFDLLPLRGKLAKEVGVYQWSSFGELFDKSDKPIIDRKEVLNSLDKKLRRKSTYVKLVLKEEEKFDELARGYNFNRQVEGNARFNTLMQQSFIKNRLKSKIDNIFKIYRETKRR